MHAPLTGLVVATLMGGALAGVPPTVGHSPAQTLSSSSSFADAERPQGTAVMVESPVDTDQDGAKDKISIEVMLPKQPRGQIPAIIEVSPYFAGINNVPNHDVDSATLPQEALPGRRLTIGDPRHATTAQSMLDEYNLLNSGYAVIRAHSVGSGPSQGCPTTGDRNEGLAAAAVVDWLNGRTPGFDAAGKLITATWSNGIAGMTGVSYNGTLANMAAITGVAGLKAIVPVAAISSWYDYYRANGLVVAPGGYQGEDADVMAKAVKTKPCQNSMDALALGQDRQTGDYNEFWRERDYTRHAKDVRAAVFIVHGQQDWNVRGKHAIQWYEALRQNGVETKLWLHNGEHRPARGSEYTVTLQQFWDKHLKGVEPENPVGSRVTIERPDNSLAHFNDWDDNTSTETTLHFGGPQGTLPGTLGPDASDAAWQAFTDAGKGPTMNTLAASALTTNPHRLMFVGSALAEATRITGTPDVTLALRLPARKAANISVGLVSIPATGTPTIITRGWVDPQNADDLQGRGKPLTPGGTVSVSFDLEPKDVVVPAGSRLAVMVLATDTEHTLRPAAGSVVEVDPSHSSLTVRTGKP